MSVFDIGTDPPDAIYVGIWFVPGKGGDWLAGAFRSGDTHTLRWRFRYYADDKHFESDDRKSWYEGRKVGGTDREVIAAMDAQCDGMVALGYMCEGGRVTRAILNCGAPDLLDRMIALDLPFMKMKFVDRDGKTAKA